MKLNIFLIFLIFNFFIYLNNSQTTIGSLISSEYTCLNNLVQKLGQQNQFPTLTSTSSQYDFCATTSIVTCENNYVIGLSISQSSTSSNLIKNSDLNCFAAINKLNLVSTNIDSDVLTSPISNSLIIYSITSPKISTFSLNNPINLNCESLTISFLPTTTISPIKLSYLKNGVSKEIIIQTDNGIEFINDLSSSTVISPKIDVFVSEFPNFSNAILNELLLRQTLTFSNSSYSNLTTLNGVYNLQILSGYYNRYPTELHNMVGGLVEQLTISISLDQEITSFPDFSVFTKLNTLVLSGMNGFPLPSSNSLLPSSLLNFNFNNNKLTSLLNYTIFNNINNLDLSGNQISSQLPTIFNSNNIQNLILKNNQFKGTNIDSSYCNTILQISDNGNGLTGTLPDCYKGHLYDSTIKSWFSGTGLTLTPLDSLEIIPNMKISNGVTYLFGKNIGFLASSISSSPPLAFELDIPNQRFTSNTTTPSLFEITFTSANNKVFYVSNDPLYPIPQSIVTSSGGIVTISGTYFSYNSSIINVTIDGVPCVINQSPTFNQIVCTLQTYNSSKTNVEMVIKVDQETSTFTLGSLMAGVVNKINDCPSSCSGHGQCDLDTQTCACDSGWSLSDCSLGTIECSDPTCSGHGVCQTKTGQCECDILYTGTTCIIPSQYISSAEAPGEVGGITVLNGWFGNIHNNLTITIGTLKCIPITNQITSTQINCTIGPGQGVKDIIISQNGFQWTGQGYFRYYSGFYRCPRDCSNHGICDSTNGKCNCFDDWAGNDCFSKDNQQTETSVDGGNGNLKNQDVTYEISIFKIVEYDITGQVAAEYFLRQNWQVLPNQNSSLKVYTFSQTIGFTNATIIQTLEEIQSDETRTFGGVNFDVVKGSIKLSISIQNYRYQSTLNNLQLQLKSSITSTEDCNDSPNVEETDGNKLNYLTITKNDKRLYGRFINQVISDGQSTYSTSKVLSSRDSDQLIIGLNLPHCTSECLIDPDFRLLVDPSYEKSCKDKPWLLPVAIVIPVVAVSIIILVSIILYKKNRTFIQIKLKTLKDKY